MELVTYESLYLMPRCDMYGQWMIDQIYGLTN